MLQSVTGTSVTANTANNQFTITKTNKQKTYTAKLENDEVTASLQTAIYTKTVEGTEVKFTFDGSNNLTGASGNNVTFNNGKVTIGNKTYTATLNTTADEVNEILDAAVYTKEIEGVDVTFNYDGASVLQNVTGTGVRQIYNFQN